MYANEDLDAVLVCVSARLHPRLAIEAIEAGLHIWLEKPATTTVDEDDQLLAARGELVCTVGYKEVFMPTWSRSASSSRPDHWVGCGCFSRNTRSPSPRP